MKSFSRIACVAAVASTLALTSATVASAKALCISVSDGVNMIFPKAKIPKGGAVQPLLGQSTGGVLLTGAVRMNTAGTISISTVFATAGSVSTGFRYSWSGNGTLAGSGNVDADGDGVSDGARSFTIIDCDTVSIP